jgi:hypothetical protein
MGCYIDFQRLSFPFGCMKDMPINGHMLNGSE